MRYYVPANEFAAVTRFRARQRKLEVLGCLPGFLGVVVAAWALLN
jgi:hypothetical protein